MAGRLTPQPLPENNFPSDTDIRKAYDQCLALEQYESCNSVLQKDCPNSCITTSDMNLQVVARILGYAILFAPSDDGLTALTRDIIGCGRDSELLFGLAYLYIYGMIRPLYNSSSINPRSCFDLDNYECHENIKHLAPYLEPEEWTPELTAAWDLRKQLLSREDNHCILTGAYDFTQIETPPLEDLAVRETLWTFDTRVTYIISRLLLEDIHLQGMSHICEKFEWATTARAIIEHFGGSPFHDLLCEDVLNGPLNAFTSSHEAQYTFNEFFIWLTPAEDDDHRQVIPNTYDVQCSLGNDTLPWLASRGVKSRITFRSTEFNEKIIPPPHPCLVGLHSVCARIAHMSGAMKYIEEWFQDSDSDCD